MIDVIVPAEYASLVDPILLEKAAQLTLEHEEITEEMELSIAVDSDERVHELNLQFLGIDSPTDVLSFPANEFDPDTGLTYLGDIILSCPKAQAQAAAAGATLSDEFQLLVVHGVLHLAGHDHAEPGEKERMWKAQDTILKKLGVNLLQLPE
jgi:probable rRNA maturation factor